MEEVVTLLLTLLSVVVLSSSQRVAPGVPPQQYQQQQQQYQQPQYQQPQMQAHQVPVQQAPQYQQPHVQTQFHEVPQQVHPQQGHAQQAHAQGHHHAHGQPQQLLNTANIALEKEHIQEHLEVPIDTSKMTEQELQFHYFKMHDADNNNKLDGCELIKSLIHWHEQGHKDPHGQVPSGQGKLFTDEELISLIDPILAVDDANKDGYIDYPEFVQENEGDKSEARVQKDSDLEAMVDPILKEMDTNNDGFVDYAEFKKAS